MICRKCDRENENAFNLSASMLGRLFNIQKRKPAPLPEISLGRYSDNNKSVEQGKMWTDAENLFKEKKYRESLTKFFGYLNDPAIDNVQFDISESNISFTIYQGTKIIRGYLKDEIIYAQVALARMQQPSVPVMRRLLENNYQLYYSRFSLEGDRLLMQFETEVATANPNKMYYALKELSVTSDKQDDLLIQDFSLLEALDSDHVAEMEVSEKEFRYNFMINWIDETLKQIQDLDKEKFSGAISYLILSLVYRIDFLIGPQGPLMNELENIQGIYFKKDNLSTFEKNRLMLTALEKFRAHDRNTLMKGFFISKSTFSIRQPKAHSFTREAIQNANKNITWYKDNNHPDIASKIAEYGFAYSQYTYSLPKPLVDMFNVFMRVNYPEYFKKLGFSESLYDEETKRFRPQQIEDELHAIVRKWKPKYPRLSFSTSKLKFDDMVSFNTSFTNIVADLDFES